MKLSLTSWSLPSCNLNEVAAISKALGIHAIDVGLFYRSALSKQQILNNPLNAAKDLVALDIDIPNYYHLFGDDLASRNLSSTDSFSENLADLEKVLSFADAANIGSVFILPGVVNHNQSRKDAMNVSINSLKQMVALADGYKTTLCIEPHVHSYAESPKIVQQLVEETGVKLALDYAHFICLGYRQEEIDPLTEHAAHIHLRQAKMGELQAKFELGTINFPALFGQLRDVGYEAAMAIEPVHQSYMNTLYDDVITEIIALRDCYNDWKG